MNTAPSPIEDQLRATLRRHAGEPAPRGDAGEVRRRVQRRRRRRQVVPAVGAVAVISAGLVAFSVATDDRERTTTAAEGEDPAVEGPDVAPSVAASTPPLLLLDGWQTVRYYEIKYHADATVVVEPEYEFVRDDRRLQLHLYPGGQEMYDVRVGGEVRTPASALGRDGSLLDYGTNGRFRLDVLIGSYVWEFDGEPFASADDFLAAVNQVQAVDQATWEASVASADRNVLDTDTPPGEPIGANANVEAEVGPPPPVTGDVTPTSTPAGK